MPLVSVLMPVYNAALYLSAAIESVQAQTMQDFELIIVDDGSTDASLELARSYADRDNRIHVYAQSSNCGEGPTRNAALARATGDWIYSIDADDMALPTLLEEAVSCAEANDADVTVFRTTMFDNKSEERLACDWAFDAQWFDKQVFSPVDYPEHILNAFQNWTWNKLFKASFIKEHSIVFQNIHRTADLLFTCRALTEASAIALLDRPLHLYRVNNEASAFLTGYKYPLDFYNGFIALKEHLVAQGIYELYRKTFINHALDSFWANVRVCFNDDSLVALLTEYKERGFELFEIAGFPKRDAYSLGNYERCQYLVSHDLEHGLAYIAIQFALEARGLDTALSYQRLESARQREEIGTLVERIHDFECGLHAKQDELDAVKGSISFKIGRALTLLPRRLRDGLGA